MDKRAERKLQRARLIEARHALTDRPRLEAALQDRARAWLEQTDVLTLGFYSPIRGEPDLRAVIAHWLSVDPRRVAALPAIDGSMLRYHAWTEDSRLQPGSYGIPVCVGDAIVQPHCLMIPCVGFDRERYRLGFGGGYYDRTLAALSPRPLVVGIAFEVSRLESIDPQPHDVQMDLVITEAGTY